MFALLSSLTTALLGTAVLVVTWRHAPWPRLADPRAALRFCAVVLTLIAVRHMRVDVGDAGSGVALELLGLGVAHAMLGARLALVGGAFVVLGLAGTGTFDLLDAPATFLRTIVLPVLLLATADRALASARDRMPLAVMFAVSSGAAGAATLLVLAVGLAGAAPGGASFDWMPAVLLVALAEAQLSAIAVGVLVLERPGWLDPRAGAAVPDRLRVRSLERSVPPH